MVNIPTSYSNGTYSLVASSTYSYTVSTSSPDVTFKITDNGFEVQNNIINLERPYNRRYLLRDGSIVYTIIDGALSPLGNIEVTSDLFLNSGLEDIPDFILLSELTNPELLYWHDIEDNITGLIINGLPQLPQPVFFNAQTIPSRSAIKLMEAVSTEDVLFCITIDGGKTWKYYNNGSWIISNEITNGMDGDQLKSITESAWAELVSSGTY